MPDPTNSGMSFPGQTGSADAITDTAIQTKEQLSAAQRILQEYVTDAIRLAPKLVVAVLIILLFMFLSRFAERFAKKVGGRITEDSSLQNLFATIVRVAVQVIGLFIAAATVFPGLKAGDLMGVLGLSSVAIGFAFKDIFQNFLAGVLILLQRPFRQGDWVVAQGYEGTIEDVNIRDTRLRTADNQLIIIPNSAIFTSPITVRTAFTERRSTFSAGIGYGEDIEAAREVILDAVRGCELVLESPAPVAAVVEHGGSSVNFAVHYWTNADPGSVNGAWNQVGTAIKYALDEAGIEIPYPYRTLEFFDKTDYRELLADLSEDERELILALRASRVQGAPRALGAPDEDAE